jgi:phosphoribosylaminoimidazole-succinocarboxamide synthase
LSAHATTAESGARADALRALITAHLDQALTDAALPGVTGLIRGKVRDNYDIADGRRLIIATDRQSAFDQVLAAVPFKGQVLTATARHWFEATRDIIANHVIAFPDPNATVALRLRMVPVEVVVRDYLTGTTATSIWPRYARGERQMYGVTLPDGLRQHERLPQTILTPTTKGEGGAHDEPISPSEIIARGLVPARLWDVVAAAALALFARGRTLAAQRGLILVDTKYEFGIDADGRLRIADEIHTPDSSRYWRAGSYEQRLSAGLDPETLDKDFLRRWIAARCDPYAEPIPAIPPETLIEFALRYINLYEQVTGETFTPPAADEKPQLRLVRNLGAYFGRWPPETVSR